jgi:hypothetical protein
MRLNRVTGVLATLAVAVAVLAFFATHQAWNVYLIGGSHRWAAGAITILGAAAFVLTIPSMGDALVAFATLGVVEVVLATLAIMTGSLTPLSLLVVAIVVVWLATAARDAVEDLRRPIPH